MLAWDRTALSLVLVGLLLVRSAGPPYLRPAHVLGLLVAALGAVMLLQSRRRAAQLAVPDADVRDAAGTIRLLAAAVVTGGVGALTLIGIGV